MTVGKDAIRKCHRMGEERKTGDREAFLGEGTEEI